MSRTYTLADLAQVVGQLSESDQRFANSLLSQRRPLSERQWPWVGKLIERATRPAPQAEQLAATVVGVFTLLQRAGQHLKHPKIHLMAPDGTPVQLAVAGVRSKYQGSVMLTDGGPYGQNRYFGRISETGELTEGRNITPDVRSLIGRLAADPVAVAKEQATLTGNCCFCNRKLDTPESTTAGYGPVCAKNFGLPWGQVESLVGSAA